MVTHQKIRGILKRNGFEIGKWHKGIVTRKFSIGKFEVKKSPYGYNDNVNVSFNTGGYKTGAEEGIRLTDGAMKAIQAEGFRVERKGKFEIEVFDR